MCGPALEKATGLQDDSENLVSFPICSAEWMAKRLSPCMPALTGSDWLRLCKVKKLEATLDWVGRAL